MASRTEEALQALVAAFAAAAAAAPTVLPPPSRNEMLPTRLEAFDGTTCGFLNVLDGSGGPEGADGGPGETLGADDSVDGYEIIHRAEVEWIIEAVEKDDREAAFDAGLVTLNAKLKSDRRLGGIVDDVRFEKIERSGLAIDGLPNLKGAIITVALTFLSSEPF